MDAIAPYWPLISLAITGLIAGWIVSQILGGGGLIRNMIIGIIGAVIGGTLVNNGLLNLPFDFGPFLNSIAVATVGAFILVLIARVIAR